MHPNQTMPELGDVGGPLPFKNGSTIEIGGVLTNVEAISENVEPVGAVPFWSAKRAPISKYKVWIKQVIGL